MSTREEIREGIEKILHKAYSAKPTLGGCDIYDIFVEKNTPDKILQYLYSQGVVIQVDKPFRICESVVEPLIKEE